MVISKINSNFAAQFSNCNFNIGIWCNGNTTDSGPVIPGSNPGIPTITKGNWLLVSWLPFVVVSC